MDRGAGRTVMKEFGDDRKTKRKLGAANDIF
jgi:hypothetical protein